MPEQKHKNEFQQIWHDPVWSKVIAGLIAFIASLIYPYVSSIRSGKTFLTTLVSFWTSKVDLWILILIILVIICCFYFFKKRDVKYNPLLKKQPFKKYFGIYELYHYAPHTSGNPKLAKSYLNICTSKIEYVHKLFECEDGEIEQIDGHLFLNLKNKEQQNAPYYFIIKCINETKIEWLGGVSLGIGEKENSHPIAVKVALKKRADLKDFTIENFRALCTIEELTKDKVTEETYSEIIKFLWNSCGDKDILF